MHHERSPHRQSAERRDEQRAVRDVRTTREQSLQYPQTKYLRRRMRHPGQTVFRFMRRWPLVRTEQDGEREGGADGSILHLSVRRCTH